MVVALGSTRVLVDNLAFPEDPRWHDGHFYFVDMLDQRVCRLEHDGNLTTLFTIPDDSPSGLGFMPNGDMLVVSMYKEKLYRVDKSGQATVHADLHALAGGFGINDMVVDRQGRAYVVQFGGEQRSGKTSPLIMVEPDGTIDKAAKDLAVGNGIRISDDGRTLVVAESAGRRLSVFDIAGDGRLFNRRVVELPPEHYPDGICLDSEDGIWVSCLWNGLLRVTHDAVVTHKITLDAEHHAYACMYGGADKRTLHICTSGPYDHEKAKMTRLGRIETIETGFTGAGLD
jgi:sugar lactone lactonase YvrE